MRIRFDSSKTASTFAFIIVLSVLIIGFIWWFRSRPSYLLFQAHSQIGQQNQSAVIHHYESLLEKKGIPLEEEIKLRTALGEFYLEASGEMGTVVLKQDSSSYQVDHPYLSKAKEQFDRVAALDPGNGIAYFNLGRIFLKRGLSKFAEEGFQESIRKNPSYPQPLSILAEIELERGQPEKAMAFALQALAIDSNYDSARWNLVRAYILLGDSISAKREYARLSSEFKSKPFVRSLYALHLAEQNYWNESEFELNKILNQSPNDLMFRLSMGQVYLLNREYESAFGEFAQAANTYRSSPWPIVWLAKTHALRGDCFKSSQAAELLFQALPRWPWSRWSRAWSFICQGDSRRALVELNEALISAPKFIEAVELKARILLDRGDYVDLGKLLRPLLDQKMNQSTAYSFLAESLYLQNKYELAKDMAESAISINQRLIAPLIWLSLSQTKLSQLADADQNMRKAFLLNNRDVNLMSAQALRMAMGGRFQEAMSLIHQANQLDAKDALIWSRQGRIQLLQGDGTGAVQSFQRAYELKPYLLEALLGLVEAFFVKGNIDAADSALTKAIQLNSNNEDVRRWKTKLRNPK